MQTGEFCTLCEKVVVTFRSEQPIVSLSELPNTFDPTSKKYSWKHYDLMEYALMPRKIEKTSGEVDLYICMDEDEIDDIDLMEYASEFLQKEIVPSWDNFQVVHVMSAFLSPPLDIGCRRIEHN
jgi:hypothetical protein